MNFNLYIEMEDLFIQTTLTDFSTDNAIHQTTKTGLTSGAFSYIIPAVPPVL